MRWWSHGREEVQLEVATERTRLSSTSDLELTSFVTSSPRRDGGGINGGIEKRCSLRSRLILQGTVLVAVAGLVASVWLSPKDFPQDIVIIGSGPAGSAVAYHLARHAPKARIVVLEAGGPSQASTGGDEFLWENKTIFDVPIAWSYVAHLTVFHWHVQGDAILAKTVGGCGIHNAMLYVRALPGNIASWNMSEWSWEDVVAQYQALENFQGDPTLPGHGSEGPISTSTPMFRDLLGVKFLETARAMGIPYAADFNSPAGRVGAGYYHFNIDANGVRASAAATLLAPALLSFPGRLSLQTFTKVDNLELEGSRVTGVRGFDHEGASFFLPVSPSARVVLAAGAINTPAILQRSGIGGVKEMPSVGLDAPTVNLPNVGKSIQDHPAVGVIFEVNPPLNADVEADYRIFSNWTEGKHPLPEFPSSFNLPGFSTGAFLHSGVPQGIEMREPDLQLTIFPIMIEPHLSKRFIRESFNRVLVTVALVDPVSRYEMRMNRGEGGRVGTEDDDDRSGGLYSADDDDTRSLEEEASPEVFLDALDDLDVRRLAKGTRMVRQLFSSDPLRTFVIEEAGKILRTKRYKMTHIVPYSRSYITKPLN